MRQSERWQGGGGHLELSHPHEPNALDGGVELLKQRRVYRACGGEGGPLQTECRCVRRYRGEVGAVRVGDGAWVLPQQQNG
jgi:hypothetical protein